MEKLFVIFWTDIPRCIKLKSAPSAISNTPFVVYVSYFTPKYYKKQINSHDTVSLISTKVPVSVVQPTPVFLAFFIRGLYTESRKNTAEWRQKMVSLLI